MKRNELRSLRLPIAEELGKRAGIKPRVRPEDCAAYTVGAKLPKLVFSPRSASEAAKTIGTLAAEGACIIVRGSGSKLDRPPAPVDVDVVLDSKSCADVLDYAPCDLTVTVGAGTSLKELQLALRSQRQFFPTDPPMSARTTVGGMLASNAGGALAQRYGRLRDNVLGMRVCLSDGSIAFTGAKVVKSVAGYDIAKLFVGARGSLGFMSEVTLRVAPLPAQQRGVAAIFDGAPGACEAALDLASCAVLPMATTLHNESATRRVRALASLMKASGWMLVVRVGGSPAAVVASIDTVLEACRRRGSKILEPLDEEQLNFAWTDIAEAATGALYPAVSYLAARILAVPSDVPDVVAQVAARFKDAEISSHPVLGTVFAHVPAGHWGQVQRSDLHGLKDFEHHCDGAGWEVEYLAAPPALACQLYQPVSSRAPLSLMRRVKSALDPTGTFDPGRFLAGI